MLSDGCAGETPWVFDQLLNFAVSSGHRKPKFKYRLPLVGRVCRAAWVLAAGYPNPRTSRILQNEARIRSGFRAPKEPKNSRRLDLLNRTTYMRAFLRDYCLKHGQSSPTDTILYVTYCGLKSLYTKYLKEMRGFHPVSMSTFTKGWNYVLCRGVTDPETAVQYQVAILKSKAKGFSKCNMCQYYKMKITSTSDMKKQTAYKRKLMQHIDDIMDGREEIARVQRQCCTDPRHAGFYIDAADKNKFQIPTTKSVAKMMSKLWRVRQKLTAIQCFDLRKSLYFFRTLPDVPTGANLTATIIARFMDLEDFKQVEDLHLHVDGAGDNINYTLLYTFTHLLLSAKTKGWPLKRFHMYRPRSGHSHCDIDATFGLAARIVYGKRSKGDARKNILSFEDFEKVNTHAS